MHLFPEVNEFKTNNTRWYLILPFICSQPRGAEVFSTNARGSCPITVLLQHSAMKLPLFLEFFRITAWKKNITRGIRAMYKGTGEEDDSTVRIIILISDGC
jgi:hypothetical protein